MRQFAHGFVLAARVGRCMFIARQGDDKMPKLIRLYIVSVAIGFGIALAFALALVWMDVANLRHLILETDSGALAFFLLVFFNGIVFGGVQFAIAVMRLADGDDGPRGGRRRPIPTLTPIRVEVTAGKVRRRSLE